MVTNAREKELLGFAARLNEALDDAGAPPKYHGRQTYAVNRFKKLFKISQKGVRKWLEGEALPAQWRRRLMAQDLNVNYEWLSIGEGSKVADKQKQKWIGFYDRLSPDQVSFCFQLFEQLSNQHGAP